jgi:hypothetical protein
VINAFSAVRATAVAVTAAALVAGCSSTTSGSGSSGGGSGVFGSSPGAGGSAPAGGSGGGTGGGSGGTGNFCHDWKTINSDLTSIASGDVRGKLVAKFDTLAAEAPAAIKNDVAAIDQYIHSLVSGGPQAGKAQQFAQAFEHVGVWMAQNC